MANTDKPKRRSLTLKQKLDIIARLEKKTETKAIIAKEYGVNRSTIRKIELQKERLVNASSTRGSKSSRSKYVTSGKHHELEQALFYWFFQMRDKHQIITNNLILGKAKVFTKELGVNNFKFSETWVRNFKKRFGIRRLKITGEKLSSDVSSVEPFKVDFLSYIRRRHLTVDQIYNADESALFYKALHGYTLVRADETSAPGLKSAKDRITFMPCANASGSHKWPMLVIGKSKAPRAFKNVQIPVEYASSKNAWMTREIFQKWFHESFVSNVRSFSKQLGLEPKALLLLDNCTAHHFHDQLISDDGLIEVKFLPPNATPLLQPMDQQVIQIIKMKYREKLYTEVANASDFAQRLKQINLKDVTYWLHESWTDVSQKVIQRSWQNIGWTIGSNLYHEDDVPLRILFDYQKDNDAIQIKEYLEEEMCVEVYSDADIISLVRNEKNQESSESEDAAEGEDNQEDIAPLSVKSGEIEDCLPLNQQILTRTQQVAQDLVRVIEWAEDNHLEMVDILHLRKIRSTALQMCLT